MKKMDSKYCNNTERNKKKNYVCKRCDHKWEGKQKKKSHYIQCPACKYQSKLGIQIIEEK